MSSSRKPSAPPTITSAGGRPARSVARAAAAYAGHVAAVEVAEVAAPPELVRLATPDRQTVEPARRRDLAVVDHRALEQLERERHLAAVAGEQRERPRPVRHRRSRPRCRCDRARSRARRRARTSSAARRSSRRADPGTRSRARGGTRPTRRRTGSARTDGRTWRRPCRTNRGRSRRRGSSTRTAADRRCPSGGARARRRAASSLTTWSVRSTASDSSMAANISPRAARIAGSTSAESSNPTGAAASAGAISSSRMTASMARNVPPSFGVAPVTEKHATSTSPPQSYWIRGRNDLRRSER